MANCGVLYVATKQPVYIEEAFLSAESIKRRHPDLPITLFTDQRDHPLCQAACFDDVRPAVHIEGFSSGWAEGQLSRMSCLPLSPYDQTLNLDTDTRLHADDLSALFDAVQGREIAMVEECEERSFSRKESGRRMFNAGFIMYRNTDRVLSLWQAWREATRRNFELAEQAVPPPVPELAHIADAEVRRRLLRIDQIALMMILSPEINRFEVDLAILDYAWNHRGPLQGTSADNVRIAHSSLFRHITLPDILTVARNWRGAKPTQSDKLYDYVAGREPLPKRSWRHFWRKPAPEEWCNPLLRAADLHIRYGQTSTAVDIFKDIVNEDPLNGIALAGIARTALSKNAVEDGVALAEHAFAVRPDSTYVRSVLGDAFLRAGRATEAVRILEDTPQTRTAEAAFTLGRAYLALSRYGEAARAFRETSAKDPSHVGATTNTLPALLGAREYQAALDHADTLLKATPYRAAILAFKCVALTGLARYDQEKALAGRDRFLKREHLAAPTGYDSLAAFHLALVEAFTRDNTPIYEPAGRTTRRGYQVQNLENSTDPAIVALNNMIVAAVVARVAESRGRKSHAFEQATPQTYRLNTWAVIQDDGGHQMPHIHARGWLSGVYYVDIPPEIDSRDSTHGGWLMIGRSEDRWYEDGAVVEEVAICPTPGLLVTFPSHTWHATRAFHAARQRISYAFDVIPV